MLSICLRKRVWTTKGLKFYKNLNPFIYKLFISLLKLTATMMEEDKRDISESHPSSLLRSLLGSATKQRLIKNLIPEEGGKILNSVACERDSHKILTSVVYFQYAELKDTPSYKQ